MADETRQFKVVGERCQYGRSSIDIRCPFCGQVSEAYLWSLSGCGKRCTRCGALHDRLGNSTKAPPGFKVRPARTSGRSERARRLAAAAFTEVGQ